MLAPKERGMMAISVVVEDILGEFSIVCEFKILFHISVGVESQRILFVENLFNASHLIDIGRQLGILDGAIP